MRQTTLGAIKDLGDKLSVDHDVLTSINEKTNLMMKQLDNHLAHHEKLELRLEDRLDQQTNCVWLMVGRLISKVFKFWRK